MKSRFKKGDEVEIVNYGELIWYGSTCIRCGNGELIESKKNLIGSIGVVTEVVRGNGRYQYKLKGVTGRVLFDEEQLTKNVGKSAADH